MEDNIIELNGEKIDLSKISNEELVELYKNLKNDESKLKKLIDQYCERYPFLRNIK